MANAMSYASLMGGPTPTLTARLGTASLSACVPGLLAAGDTEDILALCGGRLRVEGFADAEGRAVAAIRAGCPAADPS